MSQSSLDDYGAATPPPAPSPDEDEEETDEENQWPDISSYGVESRHRLGPLLEADAPGGGTPQLDWSRHADEPELGLIVSYPRISTRVYDTRFDFPHKDRFVGVIGDPTPFLEKYGVREIEFPSTYKQLNNRSCEPILSTVSVQHSRGYGMGLSRRALKGVLRLTNRKGRINASQTYIFECYLPSSDEIKYLAVGPWKGAYIVDAKPVSLRGDLSREDALSRIRYTATEDLPKIDDARVPEESPRYQLGICNAVEIVNRFTKYDVGQHKKITGSSHVFTAKCGKEIRLSRRTLRRFATVSTTRNEITGTHIVDSVPGHCPVPVCEEDLLYRIGDCVDKPGSEQHVVVGYSLSLDSEESYRTRADYEAVATVTEYHLEATEGEESVRFRLKTHQYDVRSVPVYTVDATPVSAE